MDTPTVIATVNNVIKNRSIQLEEAYKNSKFPLDKNLIVQRMDELQFVADQLNLRLQSITAAEDMQDRGF